MGYVLIVGKPGLPKNFEEQTLVKLEEAICAIHNSSCISYSLEELYLAVENMCSHKMADKLYNRLTAKCENHIKQQLPKLLAYLSDKVQYDKYYSDDWQNFHLAANEMMILRQKLKLLYIW